MGGSFRAALLELLPITARAWIVAAYFRTLPANGCRVLKGVDVLVPPMETAKSIEQLRAEGAKPELIAWRERMETPEAKEIYRARAGLCELVNAHQKEHHGIRQFLVKGIDKVKCVMLLSAITSNILQHASHLLT